MFITPNDYDVSTYENIGKCDEISLSAYIMHRLCKNRMNISASVKGFYKEYSINPKFDAYTLSMPSAGWGYTVTLNLSYLSTRNWMYSINANHSPRSYTLNTTNVRNPYVYASISKSVCKNKLSFRLGFSNALVYFFSTHSDYHLRNMSQHTRQKTYANNININVTWNFGKRFNPRRVTSSATSDDIVTKQQ